jgi:hypothetical protein
MWRIGERAFRSVEWDPYVGGERIGCTMRRDYNLEWRSGSLGVLMNGNNEAAATGDRITKVRVRDGSIRNDPTVLPESIYKVQRVTARLSCSGCTKAMTIDSDRVRHSCVTIEACISQKRLVGSVLRYLWEWIR